MTLTYIHYTLFLLKVCTEPGAMNTLALIVGSLLDMFIIIYCANCKRNGFKTTPRMLCYRIVW